MKIILSIILSFTIFHAYPQNMKKRGLLVSKEMQKDSKLGLNIAKKFLGKIGWFYTYNHTLSDEWVSWANKNGVQFVPMVWGRWIKWSDGKCKLGENDCDAKKLIKAMTSTLEKLKGKARPQWFMGSNEPWNSVQANLTPWQAVEIWRKYLQPAADKLGLKLIGPNVTEKKEEIEWMANFLKRCRDTSKDEAFPCALGKIKAFGIHTYKCKESHWNKHYGRGDKIRKTLKLKMGTYGGKSLKWWSQYINKRKFWVTETNCNWDGDAPSSTEQCKRITGRRKLTHGMGSINHMMKNDKIMGFAWWHTYNEIKIQRALNSRLSYKGGGLRPVGRGYLKPNNKANCKW